MAEVVWVAKHTGLPSLRVPAPAGERVVVKATDGRRWWTAVDVVGHGADVIVSDPLAQPGLPVTYTLPSGTKKKITRPVPGGGDGWWQILVSRLDGRVLTGLGWEGDGDSRSWASGIKRFSPRIARWPLEDPPITGGATLTLWEPEREREVWSMLQAHEPLLVMPGEPTAAIQPRAVTIDQVGRKRLNGQGALEWQVKWTEVPLDSPMLRPPSADPKTPGRPAGGRGATTVTWGEWQRIDGAWQHRTYEELCRLVAGMPS